MVEYWNIGKMGFGKLEGWVNGVIVLTIKIKWIISFNPPAADHHSRIPFFLV